MFVCICFFKATDTVTSQNIYVFTWITLYNIISDYACSNNVILSDNYKIVRNAAGCHRFLISVIIPEGRENALHYSRFPGRGLSSGSPDNEPGIVPTYRCVSLNDNIKVGLNQIWWKDVDWIRVVLVIWPFEYSVRIINKATESPVFYNLWFESVSRDSPSNTHSCVRCDPLCFRTRKQEVNLKNSFFMFKITALLEKMFGAFKHENEEITFY